MSSKNLSSLFRPVTNVQTSGEPEPVEHQQTIEEEYMDDDSDQPSDEETAPDNESFMDGVSVEDIPEDLQDRYRQMQADYTRKTQSLADQKRQLESVQQKADLFDRISTDPKFRRAYEAILSDGSPTAEAVDMGTDRVDPREVFEEADVTIPAIEAVAASVIEKQLFPVLDKYKAIIDDLQSQQVQSRWESLVSKYPGAESKLNEISQFAAQNPGLTLEQAFYAVAGPDIQNMAPKRNPVKATPQKRRVALGPSRSGNTGGHKTVDTTRKSLAELVRMQREGRLPAR